MSEDYRHGNVARHRARLCLDIGVGGLQGIVGALLSQCQRHDDMQRHDGVGGGWLDCCAAHFGGLRAVRRELSVVRRQSLVR